jgi:hypothetical protein
MTIILYRKCQGPFPPLGQHVEEIGLLVVQLGVSDLVDIEASTPNCLRVSRKRLNGNAIYAAKHEEKINGHRFKG